MTEERGPIQPNVPGPAEPGADEGGPVQGEFRDGAPRPGFADQDPGMPRGPRRSRYGRRRMPTDGQGEHGAFQGDREPRENRPPRMPEPTAENVESFLPSFIAGPTNGVAANGGVTVAEPIDEPPPPPPPEIHAATLEFAEWERNNPELRGQLISNPTVRRGEPIVRGTRIPARILAAIAKMGSSVDEMIQDYPALTREGLDAALAFAAANPRQPR